MQPQSPKDPRLPPGIDMPPPGVYFPRPPYGLGPETGHISGEEWARQQAIKKEANTLPFSISIFSSLVLFGSVFLPWYTVGFGVINLSVNGLNQIAGSAANLSTRTGNTNVEFPIAGVLVLILAFLIFIVEIGGLLAKEVIYSVGGAVFGAGAAGVLIWRLIDASQKISDYKKSVSNPPTDNPFATALSGSVTAYIDMGLIIGVVASVIILITNIYFMIQS